MVAKLSPLNLGLFCDFCPAHIFACCNKLCILDVSTDWVRHHFHVMLDECDHVNELSSAIESFQYLTCRNFTFLLACMEASESQVSYSLACPVLSCIAHLPSYYNIHSKRVKGFDVLRFHYWPVEDFLHVCCSDLMFVAKVFL